MRTITVYTDIKSPYAYLAKDPIYDLAAQTGAVLAWLPYTLDIPSYLDSAQLGPEELCLLDRWRRLALGLGSGRGGAARRGRPGGRAGGGARPRGRGPGGGRG